jgi:predicted DNA binding CopG/RHH family protein
MLGQKEREILTAFDAGKLKRSPDGAVTRKRHQKFAEAMLEKDERISIHLSSKDLLGLQKRALAEGIPYQALAASIIHNYVKACMQEDC